MVFSMTKPSEPLHCGNPINCPITKISIMYSKRLQKKSGKTRIILNTYKYLVVLWSGQTRELCDIFLQVCIFDVLQKTKAIFKHRVKIFCMDC